MKNVTVEATEINIHLAITHADRPAASVHNAPVNCQMELAT